ncbi:MAG: DNA helicase RecQ [Pseudomonadota bacterium]|nr:DNA helicase RecQ [Pseudomonadota bacterium]
MHDGQTSLLPLLKRYFGFDGFRPLQEAIIEDSLAGRDVFALLPTGGGKSLCYQLPALARPGLTVVVSPLIALMKDQVDALHASGIAATYLNSSLSPAESQERLRGLREDRFRLLYLAPERLMVPGVLADLGRRPVGLVAIDEAHCISEWGHDFRPEYRQLTELRDHFPGVPLMALTATATPRVREDIVALLRLREPRCYVASFNRPNLLYRVVAKSRAYRQTRAFLNERGKDSGIVYCLSRKTADTLAAHLQSDGIAAASYHAGMASQDRAAQQERFLRDEVRVMCATIAFGMGINKPNVRFVLHYDLPKNVEGYYQETGRAGRDGLPSECLLLFDAADAIKLKRFIDQKPDAEERRIAREQLDRMVHYAESADCRRGELLRYFGEALPPGICGGCDNCLSPRASFDGTVAAQKFLSCIYRIRELSGFGVGLHHVVAVLTGAVSEKLRKWGHERLSTYAIGREHSRDEWAAIGRELMRQGFVSQDPARFNVLDLTEEGRALLRERRRVTLTKAETPLREARTSRAGEIDCDEPLFERLRALRKHLADARDVPAYIVFSDVALRQMARSYPTQEAAFMRIAGVGQAKLAEFGPAFMAEIAAFLKEHPRREFSEIHVPAAHPDLGDSARETLRRFRAGQSPEHIAEERGFVLGTVYAHLTQAIEAGEPVEIGTLIGPEDERAIREAFDALGGANLSGVRERLDGYDFGLLRIYRAARLQRGDGLINAVVEAD